MKPDIPYTAILCRYGEIALKKQNRKRFEVDLVTNIKHALREIPDVKVLRAHGRMVIHFRDDRVFTADEQGIIHENLPRVFGLTSFSFGLRVPSELANIEQTILHHFPAIMEQYAERDEVTYRMRARRSDKHFPKRSKDVEIHFAELLLEKYPKLKLNLSEAELTIALEIRHEFSFLSFDQVNCPGGLPTGSSSPALALLSGGIDSPVACHMMMGRGSRLDFLTFHSYPYTTVDLLEKVAKLAHVLNRWQLPGKLYACNMVEAQKAMRDECQPRFRTILYRRLMFRVAEELAKKLHDEALVTGESLGQVASQTIRNLDCINASTDMLVLRPLLGIDKIDTTRRARGIGTYDLSNIQCADSCTVFMPDSPATNARRHLLEQEEAKLDYDNLLSISLQAITELSIPDGEEREIDLF